MIFKKILVQNFYYFIKLEHYSIELEGIAKESKGRPDASNLVFIVELLFYD